MKFSRLVTHFTVAIALLVALSACKKEVALPPQRTAEVPVAVPLEQETMDWDDYTGRVQAIEQVDVRSRVSGYINAIEFTEGKLVQKGDSLFTIDPRPYEAEVARAEAEVARAKAQATLAQLDLERAQTLRTQKVISTEEYDTKSTTASQGASNVRSAEAALQTAKLNLDYCYIKAPIAGRASLARVTAGNLVQPGGEILTTIVSQNPMYVYLDADENALLRYNKLQMESGATTDPAEMKIPILLELSNETGYPHTGHIDFVDNRVDPNTGTIRLRGLFENSTGFLTPGLFARVRVPGSPKYNGLLLPDSAINTNQNLKYVLTLNAEDKVEQHNVELGPLNDGFRVIKSGIKPGDRVVLSGFHMARTGTVVKPRLQILKPNGEVVDASPASPAPATPEVKKEEADHN